MGVLYADNGKIYCNSYFEIYIPKEYFENEVAISRGASIETLGIVYCREFPEKGEVGPIRLINIPTTVNFMVYETKDDVIRVHDTAVDVLTLQYLKDAYVLHQTIPKGREIGQKFLERLLAGKLPRTLNYESLIDMWWKNLEIAGISYKVPSKIYEMIIAEIYRDPNNMKKRFGQYYGKQSNPDPYNYKTGNVREIVKNLSTFSGLVFEDISSMITQGVNNSTEGVEEPVSPLEKIIYM